MWEKTFGSDSVNFYDFRSSETYTIGFLSYGCERKKILLDLEKKILITGFSLI